MPRCILHDNRGLRLGEKEQEDDSLTELVKHLRALHGGVFEFEGSDVLGVSTTRRHEDRTKDFLPDQPIDRHRQ